MDIPPCLDGISEFYHVNPQTIVQIIEKKHSNTIGPMGIQSGWLPLLEKAGFNIEEIKNNSCKNIAAGAWILAYSARQKQTSKIVEQKGTDLPPIGLTGDQKNLTSCALDAAKHQHVSPSLFLGILATEGGRTGQIVRNSNGTYDMGPAQINSSHLPELLAKGISRDQVINDGCLNIHIGAWILARELGNETPQHPKEFWQRVGNYNSRTPEYNQAYQLKVWRHVIRLPHSQPNG